MGRPRKIDMSLPTTQTSRPARPSPDRLRRTWCEDFRACFRRAFGAGTSDSRVQRAAGMLYHQQDKAEVFFVVLPPAPPDESVPVVERPPRNTACTIHFDRLPDTTGAPEGTRVLRGVEILDELRRRVAR